MFAIVTTRFNNTTYEENLMYRKKHNIPCIYGSPIEMSTSVRNMDMLFVVEMNNEKNKIEGIGIIRNKTWADKYYRIYKIGDYNRYVYKGIYHLSRETLIEMNEELVKAIEVICFKEKSHLKRGYGFTAITEKLMKKNKNKNINVQKNTKKCFVDVYKIENKEI
jgi:hypothetical protein